MTLERRRYRFGSFSWYLLVILLVAVYYWFFDDLTVFFTVSGITISVFFVLWFIARRGVSSRRKTVHDGLVSHHRNVKSQYKQQSESKVKFCDECSAKIEKDSTFCSTCGTEI